MKRILMLALAMMMLALGAAAEETIPFFSQTQHTFSVTEHEVTFGEDNRLFGHLYLPEGEGPFPTIIMSHGLNSSQSSWAYSAQMMAASGFACYTFDYRGGNTLKLSSGKSTDMTVLTEKEDLHVVLDDILAQPFCDTDNVFLMGSSFGGLVSALVAPECQEQIRAIALYCPALVLPENTRRDYPTDADIQARPMHDGMPLGKAYFSTMREIDADAAIAAFGKPVLLVHGDADEMVPLASSQKAAQLYPDARLEVLPGEEHSFSQAGKEAAAKLVYTFLTGLMAQ